MAQLEQPPAGHGGPGWTPSGETARPTWGWIAQAITGAFVLVLVTLHMIANHFIVAGGLRDFADVVAYLSNPVVVVLEVCFLVAVTWHGLLGLRAVLFDFGLSRRVETAITRVFTVLGLAIVAYGLWLTWTITSYH
jgi:succinate dehydrogenase hydrophobic anchor subunit